jgi:hypothetical protein
VKTYWGMLYLCPHSMLLAVAAWTAEEQWEESYGLWCPVPVWTTVEQWAWTAKRILGINTVRGCDITSTPDDGDGSSLWNVVYQLHIHLANLLRKLHYAVYCFTFHFGDVIIQMCHLIWKDPVLWHNTIGINKCTFLQCAHMHVQIQG